MASFNVIVLGSSKSYVHIAFVTDFKTLISANTNQSKPMDYKENRIVYLIYKY